jgi:two-component system response regulator HydG
LKENEIVILVVDDERDHADGIAEALEIVCAKAIAVYKGSDALEIVRSQRVDVVVTDLKMEDDIDGLTLLKEISKYSRHTQVILITAYGTIDTCKEAIRQGAYDYLVKPIDIDQLRTLVKQAARRSIRLFGDSGEKQSEDGRDFVFEGVFSKSPVMQGIIEILRRVAPTNISVLIEGQSGTGKELFARAIHNNSPRRDKPFSPINCAGLTETLLESELFGHAKGAFTGAIGDRKGIFEIADKGTILLDEIGDMPLSMQAKLLRFLEDGLVTPVGTHKTVKVDVRIISATNRDLTSLIDENKFRQDLYFRIKGVSVTLPSLRERTEDISDLIDYFLREAATEVGSEVSNITDSALAILRNYDWPGNIRQLRNCIRTMVVMCDHDTLDVQDIPPEIHRIRQLSAGTRTSASLGGVSLNDLEKQAIQETLAKTGGNREKAAKILGIGERTLYRKIKEYNL